MLDLQSLNIEQKQISARISELDKVLAAPQITVDCKDIDLSKA